MAPFLAFRLYMLASLTRACCKAPTPACLLMFLQNADDLFVCETLALYSLVLSMGQSLLLQRGKVSRRDAIDLLLFVSAFIPFVCIAMDYRIWHCGSQRHQ